MSKKFEIWIEDNVRPITTIRGEDMSHAGIKYFNKFPDGHNKIVVKRGNRELEMERPRKPIKETISDAVASIRDLARLKGV